MQSGRDVEINLPQANNHFIFSVVCVKERKGGREREGGERKNWGERKYHNILWWSSYVMLL